MPARKKKKQFPAGCEHLCVRLFFFVGSNYLKCGARACFSQSHSCRGRVADLRPPGIIARASRATFRDSEPVESNSRSIRQNRIRVTFCRAINEVDAGSTEDNDERGKRERQRSNFRKSFSTRLFLEEQ